MWCQEPSEGFGPSFPFFWGLTEEGGLHHVVATAAHGVQATPFPPAPAVPVSSAVALSGGRVASLPRWSLL